MKAAVTLQERDQNEGEEEVCLSNMALCDKYKILELFICSADAWLRLNPTKNYQDLELLLREKSFDTHLIASKSIKEGCISVLHSDGKIQKVDYYCLFSCRPKESALIELSHHWSSYEENFQHLKSAGDLVVGNKLPVGNSTKKYDSHPFFSRIYHCQGKLHVEID